MQNHSTFGRGTQAQSLKTDLPYQVVVNGDEAVIWASQISPLNHEEAEEVIAAIRRFYSRVTPADLEQWRYTLRMNAPMGPSRKGQPGIVYLFTDGALHKIGITSRTVASRIKQVEQDCGKKLTCAWSLFVDDAAALESQLHNAFSEKRIKGEWFNLSPEDVAYIMSIGGEA